jgi:peptide/nickel transport system ATP-binding protein
MGILPKTARIPGGEILYRDPEMEGTVLDIVGMHPDGPEMRNLQGNRMAIIFQEPMSSLSPLHTIGDQISEVLYLHKNKTPAEAREIMEEVFRLTGFPNPGSAHRNYPFELSGGLRQRAMIAMALVCRPALLIADEPTTALDVTIQAQILKIMKDLQSELDMAILMITHSLPVVANLAEEVVVVYQGKVMESGTIQDIFERPGHLYLQGLFNAAPSAHMSNQERLVPLREIKVRTRDLEMVEQLVKDGPEAQGDASGEDNGNGTPLLEIRGVSKRFIFRKKGFFSKGEELSLEALNQVSLNIRKGECMGLVGESGSGKSTLCRLILKALQADEGEILFRDGKQQVNLLSLNEKEMFKYRRRIQYIFQDPFMSLNPRMTVSEIISEPLLIHKVGTREKRMEHVRTLLRLVGLQVQHMNRYPHSFSGGQRQRIGIARALVLHPEVLICDEPVSALDVSVQAQILNLLKDLQKELGLTLIFVTHDFAVVNYMADRIAVMCAGNLVEIAPREILLTDSQHPYTQNLLNSVPEPDLKQKLDFEKLSLERMSNPASWPPPFRLGGAGDSFMKQVGDEHHVLQTR